MCFRGSRVVLFVLLMSTAAYADDHRADIYSGFSWAQGSSLFGVQESYAFLVPQVTNKDLTIVGDFAVNFGSNAGTDLTRVTFLAGPRVSLGLRENKKNVFFGHALAGVVYTNNAGGAVQGNDFAVGLGGGWELLPTRKPNDPKATAQTQLENLWGLRVQVDYVIRSGEAENFARVSVGVIYRLYK